MISVSLTPQACRAPGDLARLGARWRALEEDADPGFFRSWTFLGCEGERRLAGASLLSVRAGEADIALALLGRARGQGWLNCTGIAAEDVPFIEHNGLLVRAGHEACVAEALRLAARRLGTLRLPGIDDATLAQARRAGWLVPGQSRFAPSVDLSRVDGPYLDTLSANARAQIRRSRRLYGPALALRAAASLDEALGFFTELVTLHQARWTRRGKEGAFGTRLMRDFHAALIVRAWPRGEVALLRITAGDRLIGLLYHFLRDGRVLSYQSGLSPTNDAREKPGLVCHALAIEHYAALGNHLYDLLAGDDRYKRTLANAGQTLHWAALYRPWSVRGVSARAVACIKERRSSFLKKRSKKLLSVGTRLVPSVGSQE